ncbi:MAG TPA: CoA transferase, partial [Chloroflexota bacterium]|nr:CoA transferase [Chloroflexota bacterium]
MAAGALLDDLLRAAERPPGADTVQFTGADPVLPSRFPLGEAGAATIAAAALQAARLWQHRTGQTQQVSVDIDAAAAAMRSSRYLRIESPADGTNPRPPRAGGGGLGIYPTADGRWMYYQRLFPHHRARQANVLQTAPDDEAAIAAATATWTGTELEDAIVERGACAAMVRSADEWAAHGQGRALATLPLFEVLRFGHSQPEPLPAADRPLGGIRVLDLTRVLAGPTCARTLAEHGADVLRIGTLALPDNEAMMHDTGHGKRSAALDLTSAEGIARLRTLIGGADVFAQGYRPGSLASRGFGPLEVAALRPGIVYVTISAFGHTGPWRDRRGFDSVVQAASGIADDSAIDGVPRFAPANPLDYMTGYLAAFGVMVALARRAEEGGSYLVRVSLAQTGRWLSSLPRLEPSLAAAEPADLPPERLASLMMTTETPFGRLRHLK